jgi:hypothetical protein
MASLHIGIADTQTSRLVCGRGAFPKSVLPAKTLAPLLAICAFFLPEKLSATAFLYRITDEEILVGADSFFEVDGIEQPPKAVKIHQAGSLFFAIQGKSRVGETKLIDLINQAKSGANQQIEIAEFAPIFQQSLTRWPKDTSNVRPDLYRPYATNGIVVTAFQLFGFRQGKPFMEALEFVTEHFGTSVSIRRQQMNFAGGKPAWIPAGTWTQGNPAKDFIITNDPIGRMRHLFDREFRAAPAPGEAKLARPPLDILRISASGAKWIQRKPECPEIAPYGGDESVTLSAGR